MGDSLVVSPRYFVDETAEWMKQELDLGRELTNMSRLRSLAEGDPRQAIPRPYPNLSGRRVLTASFIRGVPVTEMLVKRDGTRRQRRGAHRDVFARTLMWSCLTQIFRYRFFHADLHPGNLIALRRGRIGFVDFGLCDTIDDTVRKKQLRYLSALYRSDEHEISSRSPRFSSRPNAPTCPGSSAISRRRRASGRHRKTARARTGSTGRTRPRSRITWWA